MNKMYCKIINRQTGALCGKTQPSFIWVGPVQRHSGADKDVEPGSTFAAMQRRVIQGDYFVTWTLHFCSLPLNRCKKSFVKSRLIVLETLRRLASDKPSHSWVDYSNRPSCFMAHCRYQVPTKALFLMRGCYLSALCTTGRCFVALIVECLGGPEVYDAVHVISTSLVQVWQGTFAVTVQKINTF